MSKMTKLDMVGLATVSLGVITAAYYLLPPVSRYFSRVFARTRRREPEEESEEGSQDSDSVTSAISEEFPSTESVTEANGTLANSVKPQMSTKNGLNQVRSIQHESGRNGLIPSDFEKFVSHDMIMKFEGQRQVKYQFFVVILASEDDLRDLSSMTFHPHDASLPRQPLINKEELIMPKTGNYGNYIVARFESCEYHSEEVVFGPKFHNPFGQLWSSYKLKNSGKSPSAILLYSWNFPCGRCTKLIVGELSKEQYRGSRVMLAYSRIWDSEEGYPFVADKNMEVFRLETGAHIQKVEPPVELSKAGQSPT